MGNGGHVVGSSMMNQGSGMPFIWSQANGIVAIPLATGTSEGSARAVNSAGWVVGQDSSAFSIPFLWDGTTTYRLADLLPPGSGWDLDMNTSSSALGISDERRHCRHRRPQRRDARLCDGAGAIDTDPDTGAGRLPTLR